MQQGKDNEEQEGKPDTVRSQRLRQDRKRCIHLTDLLYEAPWFLYPVAIIAHEMALSQDDVGRNSERVQSGIRS